MKQRFLREALQAAFVSTDKQNIHQIFAQYTVNQTRLVASYGIGITLGLILNLASVMITIVHYYSRPLRRPLNLARDPRSAAAVIYMISHNAKTRGNFKGFDRLLKYSMNNVSGQMMFRIVNGRLEIVDGARIRQPLGIPRKHPGLRLFLRALGLTEAIHLDDDWRPAILRRWTESTLLVFLACLAAALVALFLESTKTSRGIALSASTIPWCMRQAELSAKGIGS